MQNNRNTAGPNPARKSKTPTTGQTVAGAIDQNNDLDFPTVARLDKAFSELRTEFEQHGHTLHRSNPSDGPTTYWAARWGLVRHLPTLHDAAMFLARIGGRL
jgi:hypothetical protein